MVTGKEHIQFQGAINEDIGANLTKLVLSAFSIYLHQASDAKRCTSVALELIDNAQRYARDGKIMFEITNSDGAVNIRLENLAGENDAMKLKESAEFVHQLSTDEAKSLYKQQLLNNTFGERGGAGLGFLFIKRKGVNTFEVEIKPAGAGQYICRCSVELNFYTSEQP